MGDQRDIEADLASLGGIVPSQVPVDRPLEVPPELGSVVPALDGEPDPLDVLDPLVEAHARFTAAEAQAEAPTYPEGLPPYHGDLPPDGPDADYLAFEAALAAESAGPAGNEAPPDAAPGPGMHRFAFLSPGGPELPPYEEPDGPPPGYDQIAPDDPSLLEPDEPVITAGNLEDELAGFGHDPQAALSSLGQDAASLTSGAALPFPPDDLSGFSPQHDPRERVLMSAEERAAEMAQILADEHIHAQAQDLVLDFGELARIERDMTQVVKDTADPNIALVLTSVCRQAIHRVASENPGLSEPAYSEAGIAARMEAMKELQQRLDQQVHPLLDRLHGAGADVDSLRRGIDNVVDAERRRLELKGQSLVPETLGNRIINTVMHAASRAFSGPSPLSGDLRRHRSAELKRTLEDLKAVTTEMRENAGNPEWERATGAQAMSLTKQLVTSVGLMTRGIEGQVDQAAITTALSSAGENMKLASEKAQDNDIKARMKEMAEAMEAAIKRITEAILRALGLRSGATPGVPTVPLRPTPQPGRG